MVNYQNCIIYKITCNDTTIKDCYVGSTCNFARRKCGHKTRCNNINDNGYNLKVYQFIRDNGGWTNWTMTPIKKFPCSDKMSKLIEERKIMEELGATLNSDVPSRSQKEYRLKNKEAINEYQKEYQEKIKKKFNCPCGGKYTYHNKSIHLKTKKHQNYLSTKKI